MGRGVESELVPIFCYFMIIFVMINQNQLAQRKTEVKLHTMLIAK